MSLRRKPSLLEQGTCRGCGQTSLLVAKNLGACGHCLRRRPRRLLPSILAFHRQVRQRFGLPAEPPRAADGLPCKLCLHRCRIEEGGLGYCGLRANQGGKLLALGGSPDGGILQWYYDPLPTNCVGQWICAERGTCGGYKNLAVFYGGCSLNCLFCQNWHYRQLVADRSPRLSAEELAAAVDEATACICFFGGDPTPQMPHAIATAELALKRRRDRPLRICWETNGTMNPAYLRRAASLARQSGGTIKFDLKAWDENLHLALTGASNQQTLANFRWLAEQAREQAEPPLAMASTLLVPGYVDAQEVGDIARFIAAIDRRIPYSLLAFAPQFFLGDLPTTSRGHALACLQAAKEAGLLNVHIGNLHLLADVY